MSEPIFASESDKGSINLASERSVNEQIADQFRVRDYTADGEEIVTDHSAKDVVADEDDSADSASSDDSADGSANPDASSATSG